MGYSTMMDSKELEFHEEVLREYFSLQREVLKELGLEPEDVYEVWFGRYRKEWEGRVKEFKEKWRREWKRRFGDGRTMPGWLR